MFSKVIIQGRLDFGNANTYDKAYKLYIQRKDVYYKNEVIFNKPEECFDDEKMIFWVQRFNNLVSDKYWRNTVHLLKNLAEYSLTGRIEMWMMVNGKAEKHEIIKPSEDKSIVSQFNQANSIVNEAGDLNKALEIVGKVLAKYPGHSMAYALKGRIHARRNEDKEAFAAFDKAIELDSLLSEAYLWKAKLMINQERYEDAIPVLDKVTLFAVAQQDIHWTGRRLKGMCYFRIGNFEKSTFEWRLFANKLFEKGKSNFYWKRNVAFGLGKAQIKIGQHMDAIQSFNTALSLDSLFGGVSDDEINDYKNTHLLVLPNSKKEMSTKRAHNKDTTRVKVTI